MVYPKPPIRPVIKRLVFVDSFISRYCIPQSKSIRLDMAIHRGIGSFFLKNNTAARTEDIITPVHLAHTGNWYPLIKKLLSGLWWQPNLSPISINLIHCLSVIFMPWICFHNLGKTNMLSILSAFPYHMHHREFQLVLIELLHSNPFQMKSLCLLSLSLLLSVSSCFRILDTAYYIFSFVKLFMLIIHKKKSIWNKYLYFFFLYFFLFT